MEVLTSKFGPIVLLCPNFKFDDVSAASRRCLFEPLRPFSSEFPAAATAAHDNLGLLSGALGGVSGASGLGSSGRFFIVVERGCGGCTLSEPNSALMIAGDILAITGEPFSDFLSLRAVDIIAGGSVASERLFLSPAGVKGPLSSNLSVVSATERWVDIRLPITNQRYGLPKRMLVRLYHHLPRFDRCQ